MHIFFYGNHDICEWIIAIYRCVWERTKQIVYMLSIVHRNRESSLPMFEFARLNKTENVIRVNKSEWERNSWVGNFIEIRRETLDNWQISFISRIIFTHLSNFFFAFVIRGLRRRQMAIYLWEKGHKRGFSHRLSVVVVVHVFGFRLQKKPFSVITEDFICFMAFLFPSNFRSRRPSPLFRLSISL